VVLLALGFRGHGGGKFGVEGGEIQGGLQITAARGVLAGLSERWGGRMSVERHP
jgi:hypothetical protein